MGWRRVVVGDLHHQHAQEELCVAYGYQSTQSTFESGNVQTKVMWDKLVCEYCQDLCVCEKSKYSSRCRQVAEYGLKDGCSIFGLYLYEVVSYFLHFGGKINK